MSGAEITIRITLTEPWPTDGAFDAWLWALERNVETLDLVESCRVEEWLRLYEAGEKVE